MMSEEADVRKLEKRKQDTLTNRLQKKTNKAEKQINLTQTEKQ